MNTALAGDRPLIFGCVEINLPGYDLLLLDGAGEVMIGNRKFVGRDAIYGAIDSVGKLMDSGGESAPVITLTLLPSSDAALATLASARMQGATVVFRMAVLDKLTGKVVPDPYILFAGELDIPTVKWALNSRRLEFKVTSVFERFFQIEEGKRLAPSFHKSIWPGETGLDGVTFVEIPVPWGQNLPTPWIQTRTNNPAIGPSTGIKS
ncbi:hypothetical protein [Sphingomonas sp. TREG-RG-20F-R18-01]|uniref:hypothetical protein n=1 Tax=Sphingomonas sp. TREG-RG-20F-R18-01 TaxID=2914982 RepID=UPI001F55FA63|nr:hypothetical protein [Sphingomonas sp. TREG-RG-20F-R18-01]